MTAQMWTLLGIIFGCASFWEFLKWLFSRKDNIKEDIKAIKKEQQEIRNEVQEVHSEVKEVYDTMDRNEAQRSRTQILRFNDELYMGKMHTKEHFDEILAACDSYNKFCDSHPDFENMRTVKAQKRISEVYDKCNKNHLFLDGNDEKEETKL